MQFRQQKAIEHVATATVATIKSIVAGVGACGGPLGAALASLVSEYIPNRSVQRIERFVADLAIKLGEVEDRINVDFVLTDEFAYLLTRTLINVRHEYRQEKLRAYQGLLVGALSVDLDASVKELYLNVVEGLAPIHIVMLAGLYRAHRDLGESFPNEENANNQLPRLMATIPDVPEDVFVPVLMDLAYKGVLITSTPLGWPVFSYGEFTPFGDGLCRFIAIDECREAQPADNA